MVRVGLRDRCGIWLGLGLGLASGWLSTTTTHFDDPQTQTVNDSGDIQFVFFLKFELRLLKFQLNSNFVFKLDPQRQQISFALYSREPECLTTQVARHCGCLSMPLVIYKSHALQHQCAPTVWEFNTHAAAMRPALRWPVQRHCIGIINFVSVEVEPTQPTHVKTCRCSQWQKLLPFRAWFSATISCKLYCITARHGRRIV